MKGAAAWLVVVSLVPGVCGTGTVRAHDQAAVPAGADLVSGQPLAYWLDALRAPDALSREEALLVLSRAGRAGAAAAPQLEPLLKSPRRAERFLAALALWAATDRADKSLPVFRADLPLLTPGQRDRLLRFCEARPVTDEGLPDGLVLLAGQDDLQANFRAAQKLGQLGAKALPAFLRLIQARQGHERAVAVGLVPLLWLESSGGDVLADYLKDPDAEVRLRAAAALASFPKQRAKAVPVLVDLAGRDDAVGSRAFNFLASSRPPVKEAEEVFTRALKHPSLDHRFLAAEALLELRPGATAALVPVVGEALRQAPAAFTPSLTPEQQQQIVARMQRRQRALNLAARLGPAAAPLVPTLMETLRQTKSVMEAGQLLAALGPHAGPLARELGDILFADVEGGRPGGVGTQLAQSPYGSLPAALAPELRRRLEGTSAPARKRALQLARWMSPAAAETMVPLLRAALKADDPDVVGLALDALPRFGAAARAAVPELLTLVEKAKGPPGVDRYRQSILALEPAPDDVRPALDRWKGRADLDPAVRLLGAELAAVTPGGEADAVASLGLLLKDKQSRPNPFILNDTLVRLGPAAAPLVPALGEYLRQSPTAIRFMGRGVAGLGPAARDLVPGLLEALGPEDDPYDLLGLAEVVTRVDPARRDEVLGRLGKKVLEDVEKYPDANQTPALWREVARLVERPPGPPRALEPLLLRVVREPGRFPPDLHARSCELLARLDPKYRDEVIGKLEASLGEYPAFDHAALTGLLRLKPDHARARELLLKGLASESWAVRGQALRAAADCPPKMPGVAAAVEAALARETQGQNRSAAYVVLMRERGELKPEWVEEILADVGRGGPYALEPLKSLGSLGKPLVPRLRKLRPGPRDLPGLHPVIPEIIARLEEE